MNRRRFLRSVAIAGSAGAALAGYAWQIEPFWPEFVQLPMPLAGLPPTLQGKTLMQLSDLHVGLRFDPEFLVRTMQKASALKPDLVVYTGDYVSTYKNIVQWEKLGRVINNMVIGKLGTYAILGNHDYGRNWKENEVANRITAMLAQKGIRVLRNETVELQGLQILGLDDYWGMNFAPRLAIDKYKQEQPAIALCHNPDVCDLPIWNNFKGWILSGHTHGGQVKPPFLPAPMLPVKNRRYTAGQILLNEGRTLYINRALGHLWQVRFNVRPEVTIFTLNNG